MKWFSRSCLLAILLLLSLTGCRNTRTPQDAIDRVAGRFHVPRERVLKVAEELGVNPADIDAFGDSYYFPYNYYERQFEAFEREHGRLPTRSEVEQLVKGYIAKCERGNTLQYVYYSDRAHPKWTNPEVAMVFEIVFQLPLPDKPPLEDPVYSHMQIVNLQDESINPPDNTYWDKCIQEYLRQR